MNNKYSIVVSGLELDTYEESDISLNYQIQDILDISKRNTSFSKTIKIPGTPKNNEFFNQIFDVNIDNISFNPNKRMPAIIRVGDNEIFNGYLRLANIYNKNKQIDYDVIILGSLKDIMKSIEDYTLRDLNLDKWNHIRNATAETESWAWRVMENGVLTETYFDKGRGYVYPYIINGNSDDIYNKTYVYDLYPATYIKTIVDSLFDFAGFTYSSEFFQSDYFRALILPYTGDKLQLSDEEISQRTVHVGVNASSSYVQITPTRSRGTDWFYNDSSWGYGSYYIGLPRESGDVIDGGNYFEFKDEGGSWNSSGIYTCNKAGRYNVRMDGKLILKVTHDNNKNDMEHKEGNFEYRYQMFLVKAGGGGSIEIDSSKDPDDPLDIYGVQLFNPSAGTHASPWYDIDNPLLFQMSADDLFMQPGDKIVVRFGFRYPSAVKWQGVSDNKHRAALTFKQSLDGAFTKFTVEPASNESFGDELINLSQTLPDKMKMKDFLLDIIRMFNLIVMDNPNKENDLIIEPRDDFFDSKPLIKDWNLKLDNDSPIKITPMSELDARTYFYTYKKDGDYYNTEYTDETGKIYGEIKIDVINDFSDVTNKTELIFSPTPNADKYINGRVAPFFVDKDDEGFKPKKTNARILFYKGALPSNNYLLMNHQSSVYAQYNVYPYVGMWDHPTSPEHDLGFGMVDKRYWSSPMVTTKTLYEEFHKRTLNSIVDVNSRLLEAYFYLTPQDIAQFDFRDIIFLNGSYWRVNKIVDYNPVGSDSLTKVILFKLIDINIVSPNLIETPTSTQHCPPDMIALIPKPDSKYGSVYVSASGLEVTEDCCRSFGGVFINGICHAVQETPWGGGPGKPDYPSEDASPQLPHLPFGGGSGGGTKPGISDPTGPVSQGKDGNSNNTIGVKTSGRNNYVPAGSKSRMIIGDNSTISKNVTGSIVIGSGITANESGAIYFGDMKITQDGNILAAGIVIIDGGEDEVFNFDKTNLIDIVDGTIDDVRNPGGDSKARPIIDDSNPS
jgi:hypothetical protein